MTWVTAGVAVAGVATSLYTSNKASKDAKSAGKKFSEGQEAGVSRATELLNPYITSSEAANRQLMMELGMGEQLREKDVTSISNLEAELEALRNAPPPKSKKGGGGGFFGGAVGGLVGGLVGDPITGSIAGHYRGDKGKTVYGSYDEQIAALEARIEKEKSELGGIDEYGPTNAYMQTPGYQGAIEAGVQAVDTGAANANILYSGTRGKALRDVGQGVQQSYYSNYINLLQNMSNPATATNLANINIGAQGAIGQQNIASTNLANQNRGAMTSDIVGGLTSAAGAYMNRPQAPPPTSVAPAGVPTNQTDYSGFA